jgi:hypothetical protein
LTCTSLLATRSAKARPRMESPVNTEFISVRCRLTSSRASASESTTVTGMTGPKISSVNTGISGVTSVSTVGA